MSYFTTKWDVRVLINKFNNWLKNPWFHNISSSPFPTRRGTY